jgi:hypothetical protein
MQLNWKPSVSASALHAAEVCWKQPNRVTDTEVLATMLPYAKQLGIWIDENFATNPDACWNALISACDRLDLDSSHSRTLAGRITEVEAAFCNLFPNYLEQSVFRFRPLQEQWLGFGRGLMSQWKRLTCRDSLPDACTVIGLQPILGGFGRAYPDLPLVCIEAVLTNGRPELPEVVRLGWLVSQLEVQTFKSIESSDQRPQRATLPLALIPPILAAAEQIELARCDRSTVTAAIENWLGEPFRSDATGLAAKLLEWWQSALSAPSDWESQVRNIARRL